MLAKALVNTVYKGGSRRSFSRLTDPLKLCAQIEPKLSSLSPPPQAILKLFDKVGKIRRRSEKKRSDIIAQLASATTEHLAVDRCVVLLNQSNRQHPELAHRLSLTVAAESCTTTVQPLVVRNYDISRDLANGLLQVKGLVIRDPHARIASTYNRAELGNFLSECERESVLAFPLVVEDKLHGCLTMHFLNRPAAASEFYLAIGEVLADELVNELQESAWTNVGDQISDCEQDNLVQVLSKRLTIERWARQTITKMHSTLDRDAVLQLVVDSLGKGLSASKCVIVRTDQPVAMITHEYAEADTSPLGLGRTEKLPPGLIDYFMHNVGAFFRMSDLCQRLGVSTGDLGFLTDNGVSAIAGAPMTGQGNNFGAIIVLQCGLSKPWSDEEVEVIALVAEQTAVALSHCESLSQVKDQLFNMNLIGNLSQQLTSTLELVAKNLRGASGDGKAKQSEETAQLSFRELQVLKLIASGCANKEIANRLFLTESTVELHASRIRKKLNLKSRTALVKYACDNDLV